MKRYAEFVVAYRRSVLLLTLLVTAFLALQLRHLAVIVDADELLPRDHPFVEVTERVQAIFGNRYTVVIGLTAKAGDVYTPDFLSKIIRVTDALIATPGITPGNIQSLSAPRAKDISGTADGLSVKRLLDHVPPTIADAQAIKARLAANPAYREVLVDDTGRTAAIYAEFRRDPAGFGNVMSKVNAAIDPIRDDTVIVEIAGQPVFLAALETFSKRMAYLLPIAIVIIGLIHLEAFRTIQGLVLPLVTAILAVVWSVGTMTLVGVHLDPFNNVTPILILAVAAGHAVQVLKRYYEEFDRLRHESLVDAREANRMAVVASIVKVGPVMIAAGSIAALSFMSLVVFDIQTIRTFGIFSGIGVISIVIVELTFTPALRAMLKPPTRAGAKAEKAQVFWDTFASALARQVATPAARRRVFLAWVAICAVLAFGATRIHVDNSLRGFFGADLRERQDDHVLNTALAGTNTFYVLVEGKTDDAIKDPAVLAAMDATQAFLATQPEIGHSLSIVDMLKQIDRGMNGGELDTKRLFSNRDLVSQYLLLYSMSGEPGDFDGLVDYPYRNAIIQAFVKTDSSAFVSRLNDAILPVIAANFPPTVKVRLGGSITTPTAMNDVMVSGKIKNIGHIMLVVFVISCLLFRSPKMAALILVPLFATALSVFGMMGLLGIPLQIATATVAALAIGIGADYAIYLTYRMREELGKQHSEAAAIAATFGSAGKAVMFVATAVAGGYSALMASPGFNVHFWLGLMISLAMAVAAISTLTLFAALLVALRPRVVFGDGRQPSADKVAMSPAAIALFIAVGFGVAFSPGWAHAQAVDATQLMSQALKATKTMRSTAVGRFVLVNDAQQERVRETTAISELKDDGVKNRRVVRFNAPADIKGTAVLTIENSGADDDIWVYLPALKKVRRLTASNKKDAFVGTDFSFGDILGHPVEEWTHRLVRDETLDGVAVHVVESLPRDADIAANTGYSRRVNWLRSADAVPARSEYYGPQGELLKVYEATDIRLVDPANNRYQPMVQVMRNVVTKHVTRIEYSTFDTGAPVDADQFLPRTLERPS